ncbi:MAG: circularly permuted type 2 ATP-grasp protein [Fimbriimonadaceae bacterium]|nr:circularly permuted type 2 ATP-grasp protein [Fimbriimonadaceae bacterium]
MEWTTKLTGFDESFDSNGVPRPHYAPITSALGKLTTKQIRQRGQLQDVSLRNQGITFNVYGEEDGEEKIFPFDFVPRVITSKEWETVEAGLIQRVTALNLFLKDIYSKQQILHDKVVPWDLIFSRSEYRRELLGITPPHDVFTHIVGTDLIRGEQGEFLVLEDNCRCPSGVSYVVENRNILQRTFPELFSKYSVAPVRNYPDMLLDCLQFVSPRNSMRGLVVVLTPGRANSAFYEHSFLAREMGALLVEGSDLVVEENHVYVRTTEGRRQVDVVYRRLDDPYLDPLVFRRDSILGVAGLINAYREGNVAIVNAPGAGVADDKAVYPFIPDVIRYYLDEEPIIEQIPTYKGFLAEDCKYMLENLDKLVVKMTDGAGGYGMLMGPMATQAEREEFAKKIKDDPDHYIAQPLIQLSAHPTYLDGEYKARRVDLRPFVVYGDRIRVLPGGLTRVALREGSYVVNSSQGGGSKDTWVIGEQA